MLIRKSLYALLLAALISLLLVSPALAFPPLPSSLYGKVKVDGNNVPDGTLVRALVGGKAYAESRTQTYQGDSVFSLDVPGDDASTADIIEGGKEGDAIQFEVGGLKADQTGTWQGGKNVNLDLTAKATAPLQTPAPSPTLLPTQTPITVPVQPTQTPPPPPTPAPTQTLAPTMEATATAEATQVAALPGDSAGAAPEKTEESLAAPLVANNASGQTDPAAATAAPTTVAAAAAPANNAAPAGAPGASLAWLAAGAVLLLGGGAFMWSRRSRKQ